MKINAITSLVLASSIHVLALLSCPDTLAQESANIETDNQERWFEIEVILFKQNNNSSQGSEEYFPKNIDNKKARAIDLLSPYIQPDITDLKQRLPSCDITQRTDAELPYDVNIDPYSFWTNNIVISQETEDTYLHTTAEGKPNQAVSINPDIEQINQADPEALTNMSVTVISEGVRATSEVVNHSADSFNNDSEVQSHNEQVIFSYPELENYNLYPTRVDKGICLIPSEVIENSLNKEQLKDFDSNSFPIAQLPTVIDGIEQRQENEAGEITWASGSSYLISQDSFKLKSIANRIKKSRNYTPLLHLGWRQVGEDRRQSKAIRLFAGDNLALKYNQAKAKQFDEQQEIARQALLAQQEEQDKDKRLAQALNNYQTNEYTSNVTATEITPTLSPTFNNNEYKNETSYSKSTPNDERDLNNEGEVELSDEEKLRQHAIQQQLSTIFEQYTHVPDHLGNATQAKQEDSTQQSKVTQSEIEKIVSNLSADINAAKLSLTLTDTMAEATITPPVQPWYLDGVFKVHLDHYLYINSEFNLVNNYQAFPTNVMTDEKTSNTSNIITFKQDRRVITGEIHYFDHPHLGMIVQIRRFDPTKPAAEAVSQAKN